MGSTFLALDRRFDRTVSVSREIDAGLPYRGVPLGCVHEVQSSGLACGIAFASLLAARIPSQAGPLIYVAPDRSFHPLGLLPYGIKPERWIHISTRRPLDLSWTVLETLRCPRVSAVLAVVKNADLTLCRRFQLAAESSGATCFLLTGADASIASVITRWRVASISAPAEATFGEPCWTVDLAYCRGGRPAQWTVAWRAGRLELRQTSKPVRRAIFAAEKQLAV